MTLEPDSSPVPFSLSDVIGPNTQLRKSSLEAKLLRSFDEEVKLRPFAPLEKWLAPEIQEALTSETIQNGEKLDGVPGGAIALVLYTAFNEYSNYGKPMLAFNDILYLPGLEEYKDKSLPTVNVTIVHRAYISKESYDLTLSDEVGKLNDEQRQAAHQDLRERHENELEILLLLEVRDYEEHYMIPRRGDALGIASELPAYIVLQFRLPHFGQRFSADLVTDCRALVSEDSNE